MVGVLRACGGRPGRRPPRRGVRRARRGGGCWPRSGPTGCGGRRRPARPRTGARGAAPSARMGASVADLEREAPRDEPQAQLERTAPVDPPVAGIGLDPIENDRGDRRGGALVPRSRPLERPGREELVTVQLPRVLAVARPRARPGSPRRRRNAAGRGRPLGSPWTSRAIRRESRSPGRRTGSDARGRRPAGVGRRRGEGGPSVRRPARSRLASRRRVDPSRCPSSGGRHGGQAVAVPAQAPHAGPRTPRCGSPASAASAASHRATASGIV